MPAIWEGINYTRHVSDHFHRVPRKRTTTTATYFVPQNADEVILKIIAKHPEHYSPKTIPLWRQKFLLLTDSICDQLLSDDMDPRRDYLNTNQDVCQQMLKVSNSKISNMLRHLSQFGLLECDGRMRVADKVNGRKVAGTGKSYGYRFPDFEHLVEVHVECKAGNSGRGKPFFCSSYQIDKELMKIYQRVLRKITLPETIIEEVTLEIIANKKKKIEARIAYEEHMSGLQNEYRRSLISEKAPGKFIETQQTIQDSLSNRIYPAQHYNVYIPYEDITVPCSLAKSEIVRNVEAPQMKTKAVEPEHEQTTRCRIKGAVMRIADKDFLPVRNSELARVWTPIVSLNKEFRKHLLIDGKPVIGLDIRNSQPLLAAILFRHYWIGKTGSIPDDVARYTKDCEIGTFYDHFMQLNGIDELGADMRGMFKADIFKRVVFSKLTPDTQILRDQFIEKYPNCWTVIFEEKGGYMFSETFGDFARKLQKIESLIIFDGVNKRLMEMGIAAFNIYDSIYVGSMEEYQLAELLIMEEFGKYGIRPTINPEMFGR